MTLPAELPRVPEGFIQVLELDEGGVVSFTLRAPNGVDLPITYRYKTDARHDHGFRGYLIHGTDVVLETWRDLVAAWPAYYASIARAA